MTCCLSIPQMMWLSGCRRRDSRPCVGFGRLCAGRSDRGRASDHHLGRWHHRHQPDRQRLCPDDHRQRRREHPVGRRRRGRRPLVGLAGDDIYIVRRSGAIIVEASGEGTADRVSAGVSFALAADDDIEQLRTISSAGSTSINLSGNALAQRLVGNAGANVLGRWRGK